MKQKFKTGWEYDAHGKSRKYHSWNSGVLRYIKNTMWRRIRRGQRLAIEEGLSEVTQCHQINQCKQMNQR